MADVKTYDFKIRSTPPGLTVSIFERTGNVVREIRREILPTQERAGEFARKWTLHYRKHAKQEELGI